MYQITLYILLGIVLFCILLFPVLLVLGQIILSYVAYKAKRDPTLTLDGMLDFFDRRQEKAIMGVKYYCHHGKEFLQDFGSTVYMIAMIGLAIALQMTKTKYIGPMLKTLKWVPDAVWIVIVLLAFAWLLTEQPKRRWQYPLWTMAMLIVRWLVMIVVLDQKEMLLAGVCAVTIFVMALLLCVRAYIEWKKITLEKQTAMVVLLNKSEWDEDPIIEVFQLLETTRAGKRKGYIYCSELEQELNVIQAYLDYEPEDVA